MYRFINWCRFLLGIIATFVVYCVLSYSHYFSNTLEHYYFIDLEVTVENPKSVLEGIEKILNEQKLEIIKMKIMDNDDAKEYIKLEAKYKEKVDANKVVSEIMKLENVKEVIEVKSAE